MDERDKKTELLVGLFLLVGMIMLALLILQFGSVRELFKTTYEITAPFTDGTGIKEGTPVMLGGQKIGKVPRAPELNAKFNGVIIPMEIYHDKKIPSDAKFKIGTAGLLGDSFIEIRTTGANTTDYIAAGAHLGEGNVDQSKGMADLAKSAAELSSGVQDALKDIKAAVGDLRTSLKRINDGALSEGGMQDVKSTLSHLNTVMTRLDEKTFGDDTSKDIKETIASLKSAAKTLEDSTKKLDPVFVKADTTMTKLDSAAGKVESVLKSADSVMKSTNTVVQDFDKVAKTLGKGSGNGLLPALLNDSELKNEFQMLISNLRKHGVLWYNDDAGEAKKKAQDMQDRSRPLKR